MAYSPRLIEFVKRISILRVNLIPFPFPSDGTYSDRELDMARGFRLLVHAEIESYLEDICSKQAIERVSVWKDIRKPSDLLICFLASYHYGWATAEEKDIFGPESRYKKKKTAQEAVDLALSQYMTIVKGSNGVREDNLKLLVTPIGIRFEDLDTAWVATLDGYGPYGRISSKNNRSKIRVGYSKDNN